MVDYMVVCNVVQEKPPLPAKNWPIDGGSGAALKVPLACTVMWHHGISVMKVCNHDN